MNFSRFGRKIKKLMSFTIDYSIGLNGESRKNEIYPKRKLEKGHAFGKAYLQQRRNPSL